MNLPAHQMTMTVLMTPDMANFAGNVHGGAILKLLDQVAYACGARYAGCYVVSVNYTGNSSMEIGIKVIAEDIRTQVVRHANSCFFTMVAVDEERRPVSVPPLRPFTPDEKRRHGAALARKELRRELELRYGALHDASAVVPTAEA